MGVLRRVVLILTFVYGVLPLLGNTAAATPSSPAVVQRTILAIYDGLAEPEIHQTLLHRAAEFPLNHLGYVLQYQDVRAPLPDSRKVAESYAAIISWFGAEPPEPRAYLRWLASAARAGVRIIIIGEIPGDDGGRDVALAGEVLAPMGLTHLGDYIRASDLNRLLVRDPASYSFETALGADIPGLPGIALSPNSKSTALVEIEDNTSAMRRVGVAVAAGPGGGYIAPQFAMRYNPHNDRLSWIVNPFAFFSAILGKAPRPIPDTTTVTGRRLYFSHIDGDGWNNGAQMEPYRDAGMLASEVLVDQLIDPYPDLPVTMGLIAGDVLAEHGGNPSTEQIARRIFALPQVEVGSHTCTHPFDWKYFEHYDRRKELQLLESSQTGTQGTYARITKFLGLPAGQRLDVSGSNNVPRAYLRNPFNLGVEVDAARATTEKLAPANKRMKIYMWSGDTSPFEAAVKRTRSLGLRNINGGDTRLDDEFPSLIYVAPVGRQVGEERQIYAVNSNENTYTNDWTGPYYAFRNLRQTVERTENPRRLKGFNIYYHTYSAEREASLGAVKEMLDYARSLPIAPITTSHYAAIADGFFETVLRPAGPDAWLIENRGELNTVRFDDAGGISVDFAASHGVLGSNRHAGSLYVALDPAIGVPKVALKSGAESAFALNRPC